VVPTLLGRLHTRLVLMLFPALAWTLLVSLLLPGPTGQVYKATLTTWAIVTVVGVVGWEPLYHGLMQFRWEKDWPAFFGLLNGINEGIVAYVLLRLIDPGIPDVPFITFLLHFSTTWLVIWMVGNGPLRVVLPHWRFRGGNVLDTR